MSTARSVRRGRAPFAVFVAIQSSKRLLLVTARRPDEMEFPGGRGTKGETVVNAGVRKVREETGISLKPDLFKHEAQRTTTANQPQHLLGVYVEDSFLNGVPNMGPKGHGIRVIDKCELVSVKLPPFLTELILLTRTSS